ncbi:MAG TPA: hypothetical protein VJM49_02060, partial [Acidimicrobiales bacterium]|nr:hypothetical protein [Acidimicrobiales bacterium]
PAGGRALPRRGRVPQTELRRLDVLTAERGRWQVRGHRLDLHGLDDVVLPGRRGEPPVTVRELVRYHAEVAPVLLAHLADRPVEVVRRPDNRGSASDDLVAAAPGWMTRWTDPDSGERRLVLGEPAALAWVASQGGVELHPSVAVADEPAAPTWVVVEIRPGRVTSPSDVTLLGGLHRTALDHLGLAGGVKDDGRGGLEVWIPVASGPSFTDATAWAADLARSIGASVPELVRGASPSRGRDERARLVHRQTAMRPHVVVPYGVVAHRGGPVSIPLDWDELDDPAALGRRTLRDVPSRLATVGDPFAPLLGMGQELPPL